MTPEQIHAGECVTVQWRTRGATSWINIVRDEQMLKENAPLSGSFQDCPRLPGQYKYRLIAYNPQDNRVRQDCLVTVVA